MGEKGVSAVILAGGDSTRMGQNKALLPLGNKSMIERIVDLLRPLFNEIILVTDNAEEYSMLKDIIFVKDKINMKEKNSLVGIYTGLIVAKNPYTFTLPCDMPFLNPDLINYMIQAIKKQDIVIPFVKGHYQPLHAIYGKGCIDAIKKSLDKKQYKITNFFDGMSIEIIDDDVVKKYSKDMKCFLNINTNDTYLGVLKKWE